MTEDVKVVDIDLTDVQKEAQDASKTLKDLRNEVKQLRQTLENTEISSEEFGKTLSDLTKKQQELTNVTKSGISAQKGSYNELVNQMALLKKEWRSTADESKRAALGEQISSINTQLKELDSSIGNHQREVGNYKLALKNLKEELLTLEEGTEEYNKKLSEAAEISQKMQDVNEFVAASAADLGDHMQNLVGTASGIVGAFQTVQATLNLVGVESENVTKMIATMQNVMAITQGLSAIEGSIDAYKRLSAAVKGSSIVTALMTKLRGADTAATVTETVAQTGLNTSIKLSTIALKGFKIALATTGIGLVVVAIGELVNMAMQWVEKSKEAEKATYGWRDAMDSLEQKTQWLRSKESIENANKYVKSLKDAGGDVEKLKKLMEGRDKSEQDTYIKQLYEDVEHLRQANAAAEKAYKSYIKNHDSQSEEAKEKFKEWQDAYTDLLNKKNDVAKEEERIAEENAEKIIEAEEKKIEKKKDAFEKEKQILKERKEILKELEDLESENSNLEAVDDFKVRKQNLEKEYQDELNTWKEYLNDKKITQQEYNDAVEKLEFNRLMKLQDIVDEELKSRDEYRKRILESKAEDILKKYEDEISALDNKLDSAYRKTDIKNEKSRREGREDDIIKNEIDLLTEEENILTQKLEKLQELKGELVNASLDTEEVANEIDVITDRLALVSEQKTTEINNLKAERVSQVAEMISGVQESVDMIMALDLGNGLGEEFGIAFDAISTGLGQMSSMLQKGGKDWKAYGQMAVSGLNAASNILSSLASKEDEATEEGFEKKKKLQIAAATMAMLGGVVSAVSSAFSPENAWMTIWGQAAAASAMSAMVLATGGMQIAQIKKQKFDGDGGTSGSVGVPALSALQMIDTGVQATTNIDGASVEGNVNDTRVYVVESDITTSQLNVKTTISEATF